MAIVADSGLGQLQRLLNLLYVRRVIIVPRFHNDVKACFDSNKVCFLYVHKGSQLRSILLISERRKIKDHSPDNAMGIIAASDLD